MPNIHHEVLIAAPAENVYHALTTQEGLSGWWTPQTTAVPEVGTVARFAFGSNYFKEMKIVDLRPFERVGWRCVAGAEEWIGTTLSFQLQSGDEKHLLGVHPEAAGQIQQKVNDGLSTILTLRHDSWAGYSPMFAECSYTWAQFLRSLKWFCETGTGRPWPHQHQ